MGGLIQSVFWFRRLMRWKPKSVKDCIRKEQDQAHLSHSISQEVVQIRDARLRRWTRTTGKEGAVESIKLEHSTTGLVQLFVERMECKGSPGSIVPDGTAARPLKTLIVIADKKPIALVLPSERKCSFNKVATHLGEPDATITLAPSKHVKRLCGFPVGAVPPICHVPDLRILVDSGGMKGEVAGGCGDPQVELLTKWEDILQAGNCE